ncbi:MAG TPA: MCE family protein [Nocardioides sp.]|nr:MCE family protein [Nocardioides sp.]
MNKGRGDNLTKWLRLGVPLAVVVALLSAFTIHHAGRTDLTAYFADTDGIYPGDEVRVLGVPVGKIDSITPEGDQVKVTLHVDGGVDLPADAKAVIVAPSLVSSRYVQLTPRYVGGDKLADGATIPITRTTVPVEWDAIKGQLNDLVTALGPNGANKQGALNDVIDAGSTALRGEGGRLNRTIADLASAIRVLDGGSDDAFATVRNLALFASVMKRSDHQVGQFITRLDAVSGLLSSDRHLVRGALRSLSVAVGDVEAFVRTHRGQVGTVLTRLTSIMSTVNAHQADLAQILHAAPNALSNLIESYHQRQNAVGVDLQGSNIHSPGQLICGAIGGAAGTSGEKTEKLCSRLLGNLLDGLANTPGAQNTLEALLVLLGGLK